MDKHRSQHFNYALEALPILFHSQTDHFMKYLQKDGLKFLKFWWDHVGDRLDEVNRSPFEGMTFEIQVVNETTKLVIISLPRPRHDEEAYFLAFLAKPEKRFAWVRLPNSRAFVLQRSDIVDTVPATQFSELTPRALLRPYEKGIEANKTAFKKAVEKKLRKK